MGSKPKICKCGHDVSTHKDKSKLSFGRWCRECPCSSYMNRNRPYKYDYGLMIFTVCFTGFIMILSVVMIVTSDPKLDGTENETIAFTIGDLWDLTVLLVALANLYLIISFVIDPIFDIMHARKRREFPVDDKNAKL